MPPGASPARRGLGGSPGTSEGLQKNVQKGGLLGGIESRDQCHRCSLGGSSHLFDKKHFCGRVSGRCDGKMATPHGGDSKSTLMAAGIDTARALREDTARALREQAGTELRLLCMVSRNLLTSELRSSRPGRRSFADVHVPSNLTFIEKDLIGGGVPGFTEKARSPKRYCMR